MDDSLAAIRPVNLWIDHVDGDKDSATPLDTDAASELQPHSILKLDKVK
jgi:hypothetical protein